MLEDAARATLGTVVVFEDFRHANDWCSTIGRGYALAAALAAGTMIVRKSTLFDMRFCTKTISAALIKPSVSMSRLSVTATAVRTFLGIP